MKPYICLLVVLTLMLCAAACGGEKPQQTQPQSQPEFESDMDVVDTETTELPVPPSPPEMVTADYGETAGDVHYAGEPSDYETLLAFTAKEKWKSFTLSLLSWETETYSVDKELYTGTLEAGQVFTASVTFWGDLTTYGITITDENDAVRYFAVYISGMDGSVVLDEYFPQ